jgi:predicted lactoylglutathione lyase
LWVTATDNIGVASAKVFIDGGAGLSMAWDAGDSRWEYDYTAPGNNADDHIYSLTVYDAEVLSDSSGPYSIVVTDNDNPSISNVNATPYSQVVDGYINITATITDNINIQTVKVSITGPLGFTPINTSMTLNGGDIYYYNNNYSIVGIYNYSIWAIDTSGNSVTSAIYQFEIVAELMITNVSVKWNYVSLPFNHAIEKTSLFVIYNGADYNWSQATTNNNPTGGPIILGFIYNWSRNNQNYVTTDVLNPGYGYWIYAYYNCEIWAEGIGVYSRGENITNLIVKWNAIGSPDSKSYQKEDLIINYNGTDYNWSQATTNNNPTGGPIILGFIYNWSRNNQNYATTDVLNPGYTYWLYAYYNCTLRYPNMYMFQGYGEINYENMKMFASSSHTNPKMIVSSRGITWDVTMNFTESGGSNDYVVLGEASDAHDGPPPDSYDTPKPPPGIPPYIRACLDDDLPVPYNLLLKDYRKYPDTSKSWNLTVQKVPSVFFLLSTTVTISWDTDKINNSEYTSVGLYNYNGNLLANMIENNSYVFTCPDYVPQYFQINCSMNQAPEITCPGSKYVNEGSLLQFIVSATDPDGTTPSLSAQNLPYGANFTDHNNGTGTFKWTPLYNQSGVYNVTFNASDGQLWDTCTTQITVNNTNQAPEITCPGPKNVNEGELLQFIVSATDPDGTIPSLSAQNLPYGANFTDHNNGTGTFKWTPLNNQSGVYNVTFKASDGELWDTCIVQITVNNVNRLPKANDDYATVNEDSLDNIINVLANDTDPDGDPLIVISVTNPPHGSVINNGKNVSYMPDPNYCGNDTFQYELSDGHGGTDTAIVYIKVICTNDPPYKPNKPTGPASGKAGIEYYYYAVTTDPENDQIYYKFDWGDGSFSNWIGPYTSGKEVNLSHTWAQGSYKICVKTKDIYDAESGWSDPLTIKMPKSQNKDIKPPNSQSYSNIDFLRFILRLMKGEYHSSPIDILRMMRWILSN